MIANYEPNIDRILALYQQLEDDVLKAMIRRMMRLGKVTESTAHQAEMLQLGGLLYEDVLALIAQNTDASIEQVKALFEDAGVQTTEIDNRIHEDAGEMPIDIRQDDSVKQVLEAGYRKTWSTMQNLTSTTATNTQTAFLQACDRAYMQVSSGAFSYQEAIRMAIRNIADQGAYVTYPTGHKDRIDVAIRRCVLTGVGQTAAAVAKQQAEDAECDYMELTAHSGARPDHAKWQGQLVIIRGKRTQKMIDGLRVYTLSEIGYGDGAGFKGWNCRHNWHPYYVGYSTPNYTQEELAELDEKHIEWNGEKYTDYEISQMQRSGERKVRALKRRCVATQEAIKNAPDEATKAVLEGDYQAVASKLKASEQQLKEFCDKTGQDRDKFREQVHGFDRSQSQKAVWAAKKAKSGLTNGGNGGILNDIESDVEVHTKYFQQKLKYYDITPERIESVPEIELKSFTSKQNRAVSKACKDLLRYMQDSKTGTEGVLALDMNFTEIDRYKGTSSTPRVHLKTFENDCIVLHNHPDGLPFSEGDYRQFIKHHEMRVLGAIGNDGTPYFIFKTNAYDANAFSDYVDDVRMDHLNEMTPEDHIRYSEEVLAHAEEYGVAVFNGKNKMVN